MGAKRMSKRLKFLAQFHEIIDFTIICNPISSVLATHGLMPCFGQINDRKAAMDEEQLADNIFLTPAALTVCSAIGGNPPLVIRAAMSQILEEAFQPLCLHRTWTCKDETAYSAHCLPISKLRF